MYSYTEMQRDYLPQKKRLDSSTETYMLVSKVAYLIGVEKEIFENEYEPPKMEYFLQMDQNQNARIIRNLCMLRTAIEQNFSQIYNSMRYDLKNLNTLPGLLPTECLASLERDGIQLLKANYKLNRYIIDINRHIANRINGCKDLFPLWLNWSYIRTLFLMPDGYTESGIKRAANEYYAHKHQYPYQVYLNWVVSNQGNILYNDKKFISLLYESHEDQFHDFSKVSDAGQITKDGVYHFLTQCNQAVIVVDCENADPYKLYGMLNSLEQNVLLQKIGKIILYNDVHTTTAWKILNQFTQIPVEHHMTERIKGNKSLVDIQLTTGVCREYYENGTDGVILLSSDSDYWGLISMMPKIRFLVMVEQSKCSQAIKNALENSGVMYYCIDYFCTGSSSKIMVDALLNEVRSTLSDSLNLNLQSVLSQAYQRVRADMSDVEKQQFYAKYIKPMKIIFSDDGQVIVQLGQ